VFGCTRNGLSKNAVRREPDWRPRNLICAIKRIISSSPDTPA